MKNQANIWKYFIQLCVIFFLEMKKSQKQAFIDI